MRKTSAAASTKSPKANPAPQKYEVQAGQSVELLKALHILTRDGQLNQDSRRKLKQITHLVHFIAPLLAQVHSQQDGLTLVDHGAGKSYLGFMLYDWLCKDKIPNARIVGVETRAELVTSSQELAERCGFSGMSFLHLSVAESMASPLLPEKVDVVTALHACNTATDDAIAFALKKQAQHIVLVPCCQAEVAANLRQHKAKALANPLAEIWRHPLHTREFGSQLTNVLRCLQLEAHGYQVSVTELVGWEHSMKNELIIASYKNLPRRRAAERLDEILKTVGLELLRERFFVPKADAH